MKTLLYLFITLAFSSQALAHNLWLERDGNGPARVYFGHYDSQVLEKTGGRLDVIKAEDIVPDGILQGQRRRTDYIELNITTPGDVALVEAMNPRKSRTAEEIIRTIFLARSGRSHTEKMLPLDLVAQEPNGHSFTLLLDGAPVSASEISVYDPDLQKQTYTTDKDGQVTLDIKKTGRYLVLASAVVDEAGNVNDLPYDKVRYSFSLSFVVEN